MVFLGLTTVHPALAKATDLGSGQKFEGFNLQGFSDSGQKAWDVNGDSANIEGTTVNLTNIVANSYGDQPINVTAKTGSLDQANGHMKLEDDVVIRSERGTQLLTEKLDWYRNEDLVTTDSNVLITDQGLSVTGKGMKANPNLQLAQIKEDVTIRMNPETKNTDSKIVTISCDGPMMIDQAQFKATLKDNVVAIQGERTLKADYMEVHFDKASNQVSSLVCIGHVEIIQGENKSYAEKAVYNAQAQTVTLSGRPKLIMTTEGENAITAPGNK